MKKKLNLSILFSKNIYFSIFFEGTIASTMADKYIITLKQADKSEILEQSTLKSITYAYDFGGIEINTEYEVSLVCVFGKRQFSCGSSSLFSGTTIFYNPYHIPPILTFL